MSGLIDTSYYSGMMETYHASGPASGLKNTLADVSSDSTDEELMEACKSFECYFVEQMFAGMEKTIMKDDEEQENDYLTNFKDTLYQGYAEQAVEKEEFGIARMLYESMKRA